MSGDRPSLRLGDHLLGGLILLGAIPPELRQRILPDLFEHASRPLARALLSLQERFERFTPAMVAEELARNGGGVDLTLRVHDLIGQGAMPEEMESVLRMLEERRNGQGEPGEEPHRTDLGNARRLVSRHRPDLRYCFPWEKWLAWDGRRWTPDETGIVHLKAKKTVAALYAEAAEIGDEKARAALAAHALRSEADGKIRAMISLARSEPGIPVLPRDLDVDHWLINLKNGTLDLRGG